MDLGLSGKVAIVAGASRGIGQATALTLAGEGVRVVMAARDENTLREAAREVEAAGAEVLTVAGDLTEEAACARHGPRNNRVPWPSGKARVCKTLIPRFKSGRHLKTRGRG